jgi:hypothetical protein
MSYFLFLTVLAATVSAAPSARGQATSATPSQLKLVELKEPDGEILSYRHLAGSTDVRMHGTRRAPDARVRLKVGSRPGFVELDINRGGISGLKPAHSLGKDFLTYVLWAVSVDGKASNLGEITFHENEPVAVNLTTPYQTFWLMVTAEPNYAVVDPSPEVVLYSVKQDAGNGKRAIPIKRPLFYFTHYSTYESTSAAELPQVPNQLLQARKAVELASMRGSLANPATNGSAVKEVLYTREAFAQARNFLARAEAAYQRDPKSEEVIQFARTAAQSAENARALASGAVGGLLLREMEDELAKLRHEVARKNNAAPVEVASGLAGVAAESREPDKPDSIFESMTALARQPALWFALSGWAAAIVLMFRRKTI